uniref:(northern house mosquito) hypothetical protein n=1 Tax=Culex pipiens TaxID=7175 RepID=A0A8D7ZSX9_CULPI
MQIHQLQSFRNIQPTSGKRLSPDLRVLRDATLRWRLARNPAEIRRIGQLLPRLVRLSGRIRRDWGGVLAGTGSDSPNNETWYVRVDGGVGGLFGKLQVRTLHRVSAGW